MNHETKTINGIEYIVYKAGMLLNDPAKSFYFKEDLDYAGDVTCLHFYAVKNAIVRGNQDVGGYQVVRGYQDVRGNQDVGGYQVVRGNQDVGGYQDVKIIYMHLFAKYSFRLERDSQNIGIGCHTKHKDEWLAMTDAQALEIEPDIRQVKKLRIALNAAIAMMPMLNLMKKP